MSEMIVRNSSYDETEKVASAMVKSGYFQDVREVHQAIVKIMAGREMGFGAFASMTGVYIIQGRPSVGANLMASAVKRSGRYDYRVTENTDKTCTIEFYQKGEKIGVSTFTIEDARKAGTKNLDKYPRNMLFARAMSNGVRWYVPDVFEGAAVYTPEELGANVNEAGDVIDIEVTKPAPVTPEPAAVQAARELGAVVVAPMTREEAEAILNSDGVRYGDLESAVLDKMQIGINKGMKKPDADVETYRRKLQAIGVILAAREADYQAALEVMNEAATE